MIYKLFDIYIEIKERYEETRDFLKDFLSCETDKAHIKIEITDEELMNELKKDPKHSLFYHEAVCIFRKITEQITDFDAMFIHSAVVELDNDGYMFLGNSGAGKSTHVGEWVKAFNKKAHIINEDKPVIRFFDDGIYAYGNPWSGTENRYQNRRVKLKAMCFLEQSNENTIVSLDKKETLNKMLDQTVIPKAPFRKIKFYEMMDRLLNEKKVYLLKCDISKEAVLTAYNQMRE